MIQLDAHTHMKKMKGSLLVKLAHEYVDFFSTQHPLSPTLTPFEFYLDPP